MAAHELQPQHEVQDDKVWAFFHSLFGNPIEWELPSFQIPFYGEFQVTKYMMLELIAAGLIILIYIPLARAIRNGNLPTGWFWNMFEGMLTFVRDEIARPNLDTEDHGHEEHGHGHGGHGHEPHEEIHEGDKYVPFLWTLFLFILFCNLLGMIPMAGSPTASIWVTGGLALIAFTMLHGAPIAKVGLWNYLVSLWPKIEMPPGAPFAVMGVIFTIGIGLIEILGTFIKSGVLAVRLFANMFAGHLVLAYILFFIYQISRVYGAAPTTGNAALFGVVSVASVLGVVGLSLLELFVAFLQAYIFTFLTALFMGMSIHHAEAH